MIASKYRYMYPLVFSLQLVLNYVASYSYITSPFLYWNNARFITTPTRFSNVFVSQTICLSDKFKVN